MSGGAPASPEVWWYWPQAGYCSQFWSTGASSCGTVCGVNRALSRPSQNRHHGLAGEDPLAEHVARAGRGEQADADLPPVLGDQLQDVDLDRPLAGGMDHDLQRAPVRQQADALGVALGQADLVEQAVGLLRIEFGEELRPLRLVERRGRQRGVVRRPGQTEEDDVGDLLPVDAERQRPPEPHVPVQLAPYRIGHGHVGVERHLAAQRGLPQPGLESGPVLRLLQEGDVIEPQRAGLQVAVAGAGLGRDQRAVGDPDMDRVDIGQLVALGVDPMEIGVCAGR